MTENQAFITLRAALLNALSAYGFASTQVLAGRQPNKQLPLDNAVYLFAIGESRQGVQGRSYAPVDGHAGHVERVPVSKTVQVQVFRKHDVMDAADQTASDLCAVVKMVIDSLPFQEAIRPLGVAAHNSTPIREPEFINDAGDYEKNPSFDFDMSFTRTIKPTTKPVTTISPEILGV